MFDAARLLFLFAESPLHAGIGRGISGIDLPIQRERTTQYPMVQASGLKGCLRAEAVRLKNPNVELLFGSETQKEDKHAGALAFGDARLLLFPVRSLAGVIAWTTSLNVLARFRRDAAAAKVDVPWNLPAAPADSGEDWALVNPTNSITAGDSVVLEEFSFTAKVDDAIADIGNWIAERALPIGAEYNYWRKNLSAKLCILPENAFRDFARFATEIQTHIKLDPETKTVADGMLWTTETLPMDTLLYSPVFASPSRVPSKDKSEQNDQADAAGVMTRLEALKLCRLQLGGDATTGNGIVSVRLTGGTS